MFSVLVLDDQPVVLDALCSKLERINRQEGFDIGTIIKCTQCDGPGGALEVLEKEEIDIVFTDIKMPRLTGIDFIKSVIAMGKKPQMVVISGYDDFEYVRNAFSLGIVDYLLKPVSFETLTEKLRQVIENIRQISGRTMDEDERNKTMFQYYLQSLLLQEHNRESNLRRIQESPYFSQFFGLPCYAAAVFPQTDQPVNLLQQALEDAGACEKNAFHAAVIKDTFDFPIAILNFQQDGGGGIRLPEIARRAMEAVEAQGNGEIASCGISAVFYDFMDYHQGCSQAMRALSNRIVKGSGVFAYASMDPLSKSEDKLLQRYLGMIAERFAHFDYQKVFAFIREAFAETFSLARSYAALESLYRYFTLKLQEQYEILYHDNQMFRPKEILLFSSLGDIRQYLEEAVYTLQQNLERIRDTGKSVVDIAKRYIQENYNQEINLSELATLVSMNYSYLSNLFKTDTGMTFSEYTTYLRMEKAKELLRNPATHIGEAGSLVGYTNQYSFSRAFKNAVGMSPKDFKKRLH